MDADTATKPKYLGLLNAISNGESAAGVYLEAWADVTPDPDLACTLRLVAARERSHGDVFCRRIAEGEFDPMTANLMTWYIAEEIDSGRRLREAYDCVREMAGKKKTAAAGAPSADAEAIMACMTAGFAKLEKSLEKLVKASK